MSQPLDSPSLDKFRLHFSKGIRSVFGAQSSTQISELYKDKNCDELISIIAAEIYRQASPGETDKAWAKLMLAAEEGQVNPPMTPPSAPGALVPTASEQNQGDEPS